MPIVAPLLKHDEDADDVQVPLLVWWAIEDKAISDTDQVLRMVEADGLWSRPLMRRYIIERLARRFLDEGSKASLSACASLLHHGQATHTSDVVLAGMLQALSGRILDRVPGPLQAAVDDIVRQNAADPRAIELALRMNVPGASQCACRFVSDGSRLTADRVALIKALGESKVSDGVDVLLSLLDGGPPLAVALASLGALGGFSGDRIADAVLDRFKAMSPELQARSIEPCAAVLGGPSNSSRPSTAAGCPRRSFRATKCDGCVASTTCAW